MLGEGELSVEHSKQKITTFLMFDDKAEEDMQYYVSVFDRAQSAGVSSSKG